jgi:hypothetical protein
MIEFKDKLFSRCFDCGWGEKGIHHFNLTFDEMFEVLKQHHSVSFAVEWANSNDDFYEKDIYTIMSSDYFNSEDWGDSEDFDDSDD